MLDFSGFSALTFDCYGTLIDWERGLLGSLVPFLSGKGVRMADEAVLELYGRLETVAEAGEFKTYKEVLRGVMDGLSRELGFELQGDERETLVASLGTWPPFPDTVAALDLLGRRYRLCILSNIDEDLISYSRALLQVPFAAVVTAEQLRSYKPGAAHFLEAPRRLGVPKAEILHVAQSLYHDIGPAKALGYSTVWVNRRRGRVGGGATPAATATPDLEVGSLAELASLMGLG